MVFCGLALHEGTQQVSRQNTFDSLPAQSCTNEKLLWRITIRARLASIVRCFIVLLLFLPATHQALSLPGACSFGQRSSWSRGRGRRALACCYHRAVDATAGQSDDMVHLSG